MRVRTGCMVAALGWVALPASAQVNFDTIQVRSQLVAPGVYMLQGSGGNIGLAVGDDAVFVVDDQFAPLTPKILQAIAAVTPKPVRFVVNTHWHFDHTGGNENMGKAGALIMAHENVRQRLLTGGLIGALNRREPPAAPGTLPVVTFNDAVTFHINGDSLRVWHAPPAHTDGDAIVHFTKANVVHMGDAFVSAGLPFVDLTSGGSINGVIAAADQVLEVSNAQTRIIPGHGLLATPTRLRAWRDMLVALRDRVRAEVAAGKTVEQVLAANLVAPYAQDFPSGHERFIRMLHEELSRR